MPNFLSISRACFGFFLVFPILSFSWANADLTDIPGRLATHLSPAELEREAADLKAYPHFMAFLARAKKMGNVRQSDPRNLHILKASHYFQPTPELWDGFFKAATEDHLTCLRAFTLLAREIKKNGATIYGPADIFEQAVKNNHIDLGLAVPARNLAMAVWSPDPAIKDPEFLVHLKIYYTAPFVHQFSDEVLPADLKIGFRDAEKYWWDNKEYSYPAVDTDLYYGPKHGVGFRNVKGIGGQKRGVLGFFQKVLFFLPDAIDSMTIREDKGEMITEALVNTVVKDFETKPIYAIKYKSQ